MMHTKSKNLAEALLLRVPEKSSPNYVFQELFTLHGKIGRWCRTGLLMPKKRVILFIQML